jgi:hypothetical protein
VIQSTIGNQKNTHEFGEYPRIGTANSIQPCEIKEDKERKRTSLRCPDASNSTIVTLVSLSKAREVLHNTQGGHSTILQQHWYTPKSTYLGQAETHTDSPVEKASNKSAANGDIQAAMRPEPTAEPFTCGVCDEEYSTQRHLIAGDPVCRDCVK